ncbi:MAG: AmmeMemoRadiSam system protein A [Methylovulum sp.]|jgi:AmmeMemoRadiSam system protein A|nr:AmmeMemoRadiSam system protein A [Methylovulum sp.]MCF7999601.1 AmmeMemoRadiSam system protein A [Methylovulum sp.]
MLLIKQHQNQLLDIARASIQHGLTTGKPISIKVTDYPEALTALRASFVTLQKHQQLRGCIGMLEAMRPLVTDVAENAFAAAFNDPRFPALRASELGELEIQISILSPAEPITFHSEHDLLSQLKPGVDGLILQEGHQRGTFLPSVWESLPEPEQFLRHLKHKAGLPFDYWSDSLRVYRYQTDKIA